MLMEQSREQPANVKKGCFIRRNLGLRASVRPSGEHERGTLHGEPSRCRRARENVRKRANRRNQTTHNINQSSNHPTEIYKRHKFYKLKEEADIEVGFERSSAQNPGGIFSPILRSQ